MLTVKDNSKVGILTDKPFFSIRIPWVSLGAPLQDSHWHMHNNHVTLHPLGWDSDINLFSIRCPWVSLRCLSSGSTLTCAKQQCSPKILKVSSLSSMNCTTAWQCNEGGGAKFFSFEGEQQNFSCVQRRAMDIFTITEHITPPSMIIIFDSSIRDFSSPTLVCQDIVL